MPMRAMLVNANLFCCIVLLAMTPN
ncbi:MAG: hypothetical protein QT04_C0042G0001, partial [archaeon GW2011_AR11]